MASTPPTGPPYPPQIAQLGGIPTTLPDVPVCAVFMALYVASAATNMTLLQLNLRRGHKFPLSGLLFGFSMARITTLALRIAWSAHPTNAGLALAATILVNAGILLVYLANLVFAQRVLRARQPRLGWHPLLRLAFKGLYACIAAALVLIISTVVINAYSLDPYTRQVCRDSQLAATTLLLVIASLPLALLALAHWLPSPRGDPRQQEETFGHGSLRSKTALLSATTLLCMLIAGFKTGASWSPPRPRDGPAWFDGKPAFYVFNFTLEVLALLVILAGRFDLRFHVPDGCHAPGDYTARARDPAQNHQHQHHEKKLWDVEGSSSPYAGPDAGAPIGSGADNSPFPQLPEGIAASAASSPQQQQQQHAGAVYSTHTAPGAAPGFQAPRVPESEA